MYGFSALWAALLLPLLTKLPHAQSLPDEWVLTKPSEGDRLQADEWTTIEWNLAQPIDVAIFQLIVIWTNGTESFWESLGEEWIGTTTYKKWLPDEMYGADKRFWGAEFRVKMYWALEPARFTTTGAFTLVNRTEWYAHETSAVASTRLPTQTQSSSTDTTAATTASLRTGQSTSSPTSRSGSTQNLPVGLSFISIMVLLGALSALFLFES